MHITEKAYWIVQRQLTVVQLAKNFPLMMSKGQHGDHKAGSNQFSSVFSSYPRVPSASTLAVYQTTHAQ
jgi:hypothetical protein